MPEGFFLPGIPTSVFWLFVGTGILIQGISKSGFAGGVGILTIPLMVLVMPVDKVIASLLPLLVLLDFNAVYHHRNNKDWRLILEIFLPACGGILLGALVWWNIGRDGVEPYAALLKRFIGAIAILFALYILAREWAEQWARRLRLRRKAALVLGFSAGFASTIAHAAGPLVSFYFFAQNLGKSLFVGTTAWTFTLINLTKLPFYVATGLIRRDVLFFDLYLIGLIPVGSYLGKWLHDRVSERVFNRIIMIFVFLAGVQLFFDTNLVQIFLSDTVGRWL